MNLKTLAAQIYNDNKSKGFWDEGMGFLFYFVYIVITFLLGAFFCFFYIKFNQTPPRPQKKDYFEKVSTQTFIEISRRLDKVDSLYLEIDSLTKIKN